MSITLLETDRGHFYSTPAGELPSVTTILAIGGGSKTGALLGWVAKLNAQYYEKLLKDISEGVKTIKWDDIEGIIKEGKALHRKKKEETADLGSLLHNTIEQYLKGYQFVVDKSIEKQFDEFKKWEKTSGLKVINAERSIYSKNGYAGTLDILGVIGGKRMVIDIKTSNAVYPEMAMQIAAYSKAIDELDGVITEGGGILRISRDATLEFKEFSSEELEIAYKKFECLLTYWKLDNPKETK